MIIFQLLVLLFSAIIHEISHGFAALRLGDSTAKNFGRLTLNPIKHLDPVGSFVLPLLLFILKSPVVFGWAKPVPINPSNLKNPKRDSGYIAIAGPLSNFSIAIIFSLILKIISYSSAAFLHPLAIFINIIILVNLILGVFNLVPIPPLDGSKVLFAILPRNFSGVEMFLERYGMFILIFFIFFGFQLVIPFILAIYHFLGGSLL
ncbi:MAG: site-2 protease family protein [Patescibacteria group bacterium]|nr:site-2 protease family protein [Patescibacteria group bacterium]